MSQPEHSLIKSNHRRRMCSASGTEFELHHCNAFGKKQKDLKIDFAKKHLVGVLIACCY